MLEKNKHIKAKNNKGFTLVEMAIVILILGIMIGAVASAFTLYQKKVKIDETQETIFTVSDAIGAFRSLYGRYPCPASLTAVRGDADYGREDCDALLDNTTGTPADRGGIGMQNSSRIIVDDPATPTPETFAYMEPTSDGAGGVTLTAREHPATPIQVATGALPFRNLNLEEDRAYDGYGSRVVYAVTRHLAFSDAFQVAGGGIEILDNDGSSALGENPEDAGTAHFIIVSPGANQTGAYSQGGTQYGDCPTTGSVPEAENCDFDDATFRIARVSEGEPDDNNDDIVSYFTQKEVPLWQLSEAAGFDNDAHVKSDGLVGFGVAPEDVDQEMQVNNTLRVKGDPGAGIPDGKLLTEKLCIYSNTNECFTSDLLGGVLNADPTISGGMQCPPGQFMAGIANGGPLCEDEVIARCPLGRFMIGVHPDGAVRCSDPPPKDCGPKDVPLCGIDVTIGPAEHNEEVWARAGSSRKQKYRCRNGNWEKVGGTSGSCSCTPSNWSFSFIDCSDTNTSCGRPFTGQKGEISRFVCPQGVTETQNIFGGCTCVGSQSGERTRSCPSGFNDGERVGYDEYNCSQGRCEFQETADNCRCVPEQDSRVTNCPHYFEGQYREIRDFTCPNGEGSPGTWGSWREDPNNSQADLCTCSARDLSPTVESCPDGYQGEIRTPRRVECVNGPQVVEGTPVNNCTPIPDPICKWQTNGGIVSNDRVDNRVGQTCTCGSQALCSSGSVSYPCLCAP